jgi:hypothetical protein
MPHVDVFISKLYYRFVSVTTFHSWVTVSTMMSGSTLSEQQSLLLASLQKASKGWKSFDWSGRVSQWDATTTQNREARDASQAARKQLSENTKSFKKSVKHVETAGSTLGSNPSEENIVAAVKAIEGVAKLAKVTVKSYQGVYE